MTTSQKFNLVVSRIDAFNSDHILKSLKILDVVRQQTRNIISQHRSHDIGIMYLFAANLKITHQFKKAVPKQHRYRLLPETVE